MTQDYTQAEMDLLSVFSTSNRIEFERVGAEYNVRKGLYTKAIQCLQRLLQELEETRGILLSQEPDREEFAETFRSMHQMLESQTVLINNQLQDVELQILRAVPTPPHGENLPSARQEQQERLSPVPQPNSTARVRPRPEAFIPWSVSDSSTAQPTEPIIQEANVGEAQPRPSRVGPRRHSLPPQDAVNTSTGKIATKARRPPVGDTEGLRPQVVVAASGRRYKPWPTANVNYSRPALKPITFKMERDTFPRLPGDMVGAIHIRRQLDEQEEGAEGARAHKWMRDLGLNPEDEGEGAGPRGQKRRGGTDLLPPPGKKPRGGGLRGGNDDERGGLRKLFSSLNPFGRRKPPSSTNDTSRCKSSGNDSPRNDNSINDGYITATPAPLTHDGSSDIPPPAITLENLCTEFGDGEVDKRARRYCHWFASLIPITENTPGSITASSFMARQGQWKKLEKLKTALGHMSVRPFEKRQMTQQRIVSLKGSLKYLGDTLKKLEEAKPTEKREIEERKKGMEKCCEDMDLDTKELSRQETRLELQEAFEDKIFVHGVIQGDYFVSWITKTRNRVYWELSFADRTQQKPEKIIVGGQKYYSV